MKNKNVRKLVESRCDVKWKHETRPMTAKDEVMLNVWETTFWERSADQQLSKELGESDTNKELRKLYKTPDLVIIMDKTR